MDFTENKTRIEAFAGLVYSIDSDVFPEKLISAIAAIVPAESNLIMIFRRSAPPIVLFDALLESERIKDKIPVNSF